MVVNYGGRKLNSTLITDYNIENSSKIMINGDDDVVRVTLLLPSKT